MPLKYVTAIGQFTKRQTVGFVRGLLAIGKNTSIGDFLPPSIWGAIVWVLTAISYAFGTSDPYKQIASSIALLIFSILTSWSGVTIPGIFVFAATTLFGVVRLIPVVDDYFVRVRAVVMPAGGF